MRILVCGSFLLCIALCMACLGCASETIQDHATYEEPHQYATGMQHVFVNGVAVLRDGEHTGALPGRFVRGPGYRQTQ